jgi:hypothetical protein
MLIDQSEINQFTNRRLCEINHLQRWKRRAHSRSRRNRIWETLRTPRKRSKAGRLQYYLWRDRKRVRRGHTIPKLRIKLLKRISVRMNIRG